MLVLSRKQNEAIVIDGNIRITIASIRGNQVRVGIEAPDDVRVFRQELCTGAGVDRVPDLVEPPAPSGSEQPSHLVVG